MLLLVFIGISTIASYWITLLTCTSLPGNKMYAGLAFGFAEAASSLIVGFLCKYIKDTHCFVGACLITVASQLVFYFICGGTTDSTLAIVSVFLSVIGVGSQYCLVFLLIEFRTTAQRLGSSL